MRFVVFDPTTSERTKLLRDVKVADGAQANDDDRFLCILYSEEGWHV